MVLAVAIDTVVVIGATITAILLFAYPVNLVVAAVIAVALTAGIVVWRGARGTSVGTIVAGIRIVHRVTGLPSFRAGREAVRRGGELDPFALRPAALAIEQRAQPAPQPVETRRVALQLALDDGSVHTVMSAAIVGRDPSATGDGNHSVIAIPDLSRTVSKSHLWISIAGDVLTVTDLGSANGTWIDGEPAPLAAHAQTRVPWGTTLTIGERRLALHGIELAVDGGHYR